MWKEKLWRPENDVVSQVQERFKQWGVEAVAYDLDGTLVDTRAIFNRAMIEACGILLSGQVAMDIREELGKPGKLKELFMDKVVFALRPEFGVNPTIMEATVYITARRLGLDLEASEVTWAVERVQRIYQEDSPSPFEGAVEMIDLINATGVRSILVTHAQEEWTWIKRKKANLVGKFETVKCFSIFQPKSEQWEYVFRELGLEPRNTLVVGDDWKADIYPTVAQGTRAVWVTNRQKAFSAEPDRDKKLDESTLRKRVIKVDQIGEVANAILSHPAAAS